LGPSTINGSRFERAAYIAAVYPADPVPSPLEGEDVDLATR